MIYQERAKLAVAEATGVPFRTLATMPYEQWRTVRADAITKGILDDCAGPVSPFVRRAFAAELPSKELSR